VPLLDDIHTKMNAGLFEFSKHALDQSILRHISLTELREAIINAEIIED
jgi:hypothetical protein